MPLFMLNPSSYRGDLGCVGEPSAEYVHIASISVDEENPPIRAFVKIYPHEQYGRSTRGLANELVGYFCADRAGLNVPKKAGLILIDVSNLTEAPHGLRLKTKLSAGGVKTRDIHP